MVPSEDLLPVLVLVVGDSYDWAPVSPFDATDLSSRVRSVVVTFSYRLGRLGFLRLGGVALNLGSMDQIAALHWVQENILQFGGDRDRVTLLGHGTAGAASSHLLSLSPAVRFSESHSRRDSAMAIRGIAPVRFRATRPRTKARRGSTSVPVLVASSLPVPVLVASSLPVPVLVASSLPVPVLVASSRPVSFLPTGSLNPPSPRDRTSMRRREENPLVPFEKEFSESPRCVLERKGTKTRDGLREGNERTRRIECKLFHPFAWGTSFRGCATRDGRIPSRR
ncbi:unnamed protein product [Darwinula stevensoni]|uniref:Carboxylesterase type B domain-containing protein n=1 Tax=Darwinula stevensoni TaxID=69355 RepID=A0A7R9FQM5_9CRUS|nr:unnamed protein product [Darwinula stevensoni]CAG0900061.1 unnamed protein product [Darwinula stevensoni]